VSWDVLTFYNQAFYLFVPCLL